MKHRRLGTSAAALALALLAGCGGTLGMQPTVESEVVAPSLASPETAAGALPDYERLIAVSLAGGAEPADSGAAAPGKTEMGWDEALRRAMSLCLYAGGSTEGGWELIYYPAAVTGGEARPAYEAVCTQADATLQVRFDATTGRLQHWQVEPARDYWTEALTCGGAVEAAGDAPDEARTAAGQAAWGAYAAEAESWGRQQGGALAAGLLNAGGLPARADGLTPAGGSLPQSWRQMYDGYWRNSNDPLDLCTLYELTVEDAAWQVWVEPTRQLVLQAAPVQADAFTRARQERQDLQERLAQHQVFILGRDGDLRTEQLETVEAALEQVEEQLRSARGEEERMELEAQRQDLLAALDLLVTGRAEELLRQEAGAATRDTAAGFDQVAEELDAYLQELVGGN